MKTTTEAGFTRGDLEAAVKLAEVDPDAAKAVFADLFNEKARAELSGMAWEALRA